MKIKAQRRESQAQVTAEVEMPLSPRRAFVVQFREEAEGASQRFTGRVEHMMSGQTARFQSPEELLAFLAHVLNAQHAKRSEER